MCVVGCMTFRICIVGYIQLDHAKEEEARLAREARRKRKESRRSMREESSRRKAGGGGGDGEEEGDRTQEAESLKGANSHDLGRFLDNLQIDGGSEGDSSRRSGGVSTTLTTTTRRVSDEGRLGTAKTSSLSARLLEAVDEHSEGSDSGRPYPGAAEPPPYGSHRAAAGPSVRLDDAGGAQSGRPPQPSIALTIWRLTSSRSARSCWLQPCSARRVRRWLFTYAPAIPSMR